MTDTNRKTLESAAAKYVNQYDPHYRKMQEHAFIEGALHQAPISREEGRKAGIDECLALLDGIYVAEQPSNPLSPAQWIISRRVTDYLKSKLSEREKGEVS